MNEQYRGATCREASDPETDYRVCGRVAEYLACPDEEFSEGRGIPVCARCAFYYAPDIEPLP
jgi:hypothetical protein